MHEKLLIQLCAWQEMKVYEEFVQVKVYFFF